MSELLKINVNEHVEKKNGLSYLSWAWAWAEVLKIDPLATWTPMFNGPQGSESPWFSLPDGSMMVGVSVFIKGHAKQCLLPVMNHRNQAIKNPDAFAVNTALMRCLAKCIAMHGLGLYIYAGEDLPEQSEDEKLISGPVGNIPPKTHSAPKIIFDDLDEDTKRTVRKTAADVAAAMPDASAALNIVEFSGLDNDARAGLWSLLDSTTRAALKKAKEAATA